MGCSAFHRSWDQCRTRSGRHSDASRPCTAAASAALQQAALRQLLALPAALRGMAAAGPFLHTRDDQIHLHCSNAARRRHSVSEQRRHRRREAPPARRVQCCRRNTTLPSRECMLEFSEFAGTIQQRLCSSSTCARPANWCSECPGVQTPAGANKPVARWLTVRIAATMRSYAHAREEANARLCCGANQQQRQGETHHCTRSPAHLCGSNGWQMGRWMAAPSVDNACARVTVPGNSLEGVRRSASATQAEWALFSGRCSCSTTHNIVLLAIALHIRHRARCTCTPPPCVHFA